MRLLLPALTLLAACSPSGTGKVQPTGDSGAPTEPVVVLPEGISIEDGPVVRPHKIVTVELEVASPLWAACAMDSDPAEVILVERAEVRDTHRFDLLGLAAGEDYTCTVHVNEAAPIAFPVVVGTLSGTPNFEVERDQSKAMSGVWTVVNSTDGCFMNSNSQVIVADPDGRHRWVYDIGEGYVLDMDASLTPDGNMHMGGGWGILDEGQSNRGFFRTVAMDGTTLVDRDEPDFGIGFNHHSEPMADGSYLSATTSRMSDGNHDWYGVAVERWHPDSGLTWTWDTDAMLAAGQLSWVPGDDNPYHANSVTWIDDREGPALMVSLYSAKEIWRIDRNTGLRTWTLGPGGDFALRDPNGNGLPSSDWFYVQHDPDWTEDGRVLLYDNGYERPSPQRYSRVAEYQLDLNAMTATLVWDWTEPGFYNPVVGDADWLPNGNVLVAKGFVICWTPSSSDVSAVVEVDRQTSEVIWRMSWPERDKAMFRAERYPGCDMFANNTKYCPAAATRLDELNAGL